MTHDLDVPPHATGAVVATLPVLHGLQDRFLASIGEVDADARVPWCGRWRVRSLVVHLGRIHHWAAGQARRRQETPLGRGPFVLDEFYAAQAAELRDTLATLDPDAPAWTLDASGVVRFWHRRQTHETLVHLWDLRTAGGLALDVAPALWADTVDELVTVMHPRQVALGRVAAPTVRVRVVATDVAGTDLTDVGADAVGAPQTSRGWTLHAADDAPPAPVVEVTGPAVSLALLLWGRTTLDDPTLTTVGDRAALAAVLAGRLTP